MYKKMLKKYRHLVAAMIAESWGYFTPSSALRAVLDHKEQTGNFCEWYYDIAIKRGDTSNDAFIQINRDIIKSASCFQNRHSYDYKRALVIVDSNLNGTRNDVFASWF